MPLKAIHKCQCPVCQQPDEHPDKLVHHRMNLFLSRLDEQQRRWYAGLESLKIGHGGDRRISMITGLHVETIQHGRQELRADLADRPTDRIRLEGAGRPPVEKKIRPSSRP